MDGKIASYNIDDIFEGQNFSLEAQIRSEDIDAFAKLSGDYSTLHMDENFAKERSFEGRVVHGAYLISLVSRIIGMHFPGQNSIILTISTKFIKPVYINDTINIKLTAAQISLASAAISCKLRITNTKSAETLVTGKIAVGFSNQSTNE